MTSKCIIQKKYQQIAHSLDEKSRRLWCAAEALAIKREKGGVALVHAATGISRPTIYAGIRELEPKRPYKGKRHHPQKNNGRIRRKGGGTKSISNRMPEILPALAALIEPEIKGDPQSLLRWTSKALRKLSSALKKQGFDICHSTVSDLVKKMGYSLQLNKKDKEGKFIRNSLDTPSFVGGI